MSVNNSSASESPNVAAAVKRRPSANFAPSIWGEHFLSYASMEVDVTLEQRVQKLKEEVKRMLMDNVKDYSQKLSLIDTIQRLGVSYHLENEICEILQQVFDNDQVLYGELHRNQPDLYAIALRFRLLRQQGHNASCDMYFSNLKDKDGKFNESFLSDTKGLLGLYEATHLRIHGDDILEEALTFATTHLESAASRGLISSPLLKQVTHALYQPLWKGMSRVEVSHYLSTYQEDASHNEALLNFARLDFNLLQQVYQKEPSELTRWWKDVDFVKNFPFARDRVVECYFCAVGVFYEPEYYFARRTFAKVTYMIAVLDDMFDSYGTLEELEIFNQAVQRWDIAVIDKLTGYVKICYQTLLDVYTEIEEKLASEGNLYGIYHARESMKTIVDGYMQEARWFYSEYTPSFNEYMPLANIVSLYTLSITSAVGMGLAATKDTLDWLLTDPGIVNATSIVGRLLNDIMSHQKRGHNASAVELYMKEHCATEEKAITELTNMVNDAWKVINKACLHPTRIPLNVLIRPRNLARVMEVMYKCEDAFSHPGVEIKGFVTSMLIEPVPPTKA